MDRLPAGQAPDEGVAMARIVVGIDGSDHARRALMWAVEEARLRGATLAVTYVAVAPEASTPGLAPPGPTAHELATMGRELVVDEALAQVDTDDLAVERVTLPGQPAEVLCGLATDADMLVVGARGLGGLRGLLLGSVTQQVISHAPCPVAVVVPNQVTSPTG